MATDAKGDAPANASKPVRFCGGLLGTASGAGAELDAGTVFDVKAEGEFDAAMGAEVETGIEVCAVAVANEGAGGVWEAIAKGDAALEEALVVDEVLVNEDGLDCPKMLGPATFEKGELVDA